MLKYDRIYDDKYCKYMMSYNYEHYQVEFRNIAGRGVIGEAREEYELRRFRRS